MSKLPLEGYLVLDLSIAQSGPVMAWQLACLGATVLKIEKVPGPRQAPRTPIDLGTLPADDIPGERPWNRDALFNFIHPNKKSVTINLGDAEGRALFLRLADQAAVIVENFSPRVMKAFGLDYAVLAARNPRLVYVSIKALGLRGPKAWYSGFFSTANAEAGLGLLLNYGDGVPQPLGWPSADIISSAWSGACVMAALMEVRQTGQGRLIDLSMTEATASVLDDFMVQAQVEERPWTHSMEPEPVWTVECSDGRWLVVSPEDAETAFGAQGAGARAEVDRLTGLFGRDELAAHLASLGVRNSPVRTARDLWDEPPDDLFWVEVDHPDVGRRRNVRPPYRFVPHQELRTEPAPLHGEHTFEMLGKLLGLGEGELEGLRGLGVI